MPTHVRSDGAAADQSACVKAAGKASPRIAEALARTSTVPVTVTAEIAEPASALAALAPAAARQPSTEPVHSSVAHPNGAYPSDAAAGDRRNGQRPPNDAGNNPAPRNGNGGGNGGPERSRDTGFPGLPPRAAPRQDAPPRGLNGGPNGGLNGGQPSGGDQRRTLHRRSARRRRCRRTDQPPALARPSAVHNPIRRPPAQRLSSRRTWATVEDSSGSGAAPQHHNGDDRADTRLPPAPYREQGRYGYSRSGMSCAAAPGRWRIFYRHRVAPR